MERAEGTTQRKGERTCAHELLEELPLLLCKPPHRSSCGEGSWA